MAFEIFDFISTSESSFPLRVRRGLGTMSPLGRERGVEYGRSSVVSTGDSEYHTATPNTPNVVEFPRGTCLTPEPHAALDAGTLESRTPQTSFSSTTVVEPPNAAGGGMARKESSKIEEADANAPETAMKLPLPLRYWFWSVLCVTFIAVAALLYGLLKIVEQGWGSGTHFTKPGIWHLLITSPPIVISMGLSSAWTWTRGEFQRLKPFINLADHHRGGNKARKTILLDYTQMNVIKVLQTSISIRDIPVIHACVVSIIIFSCQPLFAALFTVRDVWWLFPAFNATALTQVGLNAPENFVDMIAFQGASGFATAKVLYNIGPAPFVDDVNGYTVEAFELPTGINGTVYANLTVVHNQAFCVRPSSLLMDEEIGQSVLRNTAWFDGCRFAWTVNNVETNQFGVAPLPDLSECHNFTGVSLQFRPVIFWFFVPEPQPMTSVVLCTPSIAVATASVAVDLVSNTTSVLSATDITSTVTSSRAIYNGLFFDDQSLEPTARARLQGIQQQLPSAVFQAAKAQDPTLVQAFVHYGFTNITANIYNTYLSLVAKSVYFVDVQRPVTVRVGTNCPRVFLVPWVVYVLTTCMAFVGIANSVCYIFLRKPLNRPLPPSRFGTLATALRLTADPGVRFALEQVPWNAKDSKAIDNALDGYRFLFEPRSRRIVMQRDNHLCRSPSPGLTRTQREGPANVNEAELGSLPGAWKRWAYNVGKTVLSLFRTSKKPAITPGLDV